MLTLYQALDQTKCFNLEETSSKLLVVKESIGHHYLSHVISTNSIYDHDEVCRCLRNLDDEQLIDLGGSLGLNFPRLRRMKSHGEDRVTCYDTRSWKTLIKTNSQAGIAKDILEY